MNARKLVAVEAQSGTLVWTFSPETNRQSDWFPQTATSDGEFVFVACWNQTVYALRASDGSLAWKNKIGRGLTSAPVASNGRIYIGVKDYAPNAPGTYAHALYVLDGHTGERIGRFETARANAKAHIKLPPIIRPDFVAICTDAKQLIMLAPDTLDELWRHTFDGQIIALPAHDAQQILCLTQADAVETERETSVFGSNVSAAPAALGAVTSLRHTAIRPPDTQPPQAHLERGEYEQAALAFALMGNFSGAGKIYEENLADAKHARVLYECAGNALAAARMAAAWGHFESAFRWLNTAQKPDLRAALWVRAGKPEQAAEIYEAMAQAAEAAEDTQRFSALAAAQYEAAKRFAKAAGLYMAAGENDAYLRCLEQTNDREKLAEALRSRGDFARAAIRYIELKRWADAAKMYELMGDHAQAGERYAQAQKFDEAADQFEQNKNVERAAEMLIQGAPSTEPEEAFVKRWMCVAGLFKSATPPNLEQAALAYGRIAARFDTRKDPHDAPPVTSQYRKARMAEAEALQGYAQALEAEHPDERLPRAGEIYDKARQAYGDLYTSDLAARCEDRRLFHLELARLEVEAQGNFVQGGSEVLSVTVRNTGYGPAFGVWVTIICSGIRPDEAVPFKPISRLQAGDKDTRDFYVRVDNDVFGVKPISMKLRYRNVQSVEEFLESPVVSIIIKSRNAAHHGDTAPQIIVNGTLVQGNDAQIGDRVTVERKTS